MRESNEKKQDSSEKKELTPQQVMKRKKMLIYPLMFLLFIGAMWLIFSPSGDENKKQADGFNPELPVPKDDGIVGDKRTAYEKEDLRNKEDEKRRSLQDFALMLGKEGQEAQPKDDSRIDAASVSSDHRPKGAAMQSSAYAYQDVNRQLKKWNNEPPATEPDEQAQLALEWRIQELERQLAEKAETDTQLELIEKSYAIAAKYMPDAQGQVTPERQIAEAGRGDVRGEVVPEPVSQVRPNIVSLLAGAIDNDEFLEQYSKPRNMGFITITGNETVAKKNSIRASVHQTVTLSNGKELQLRLLEPMRAGNMVIPANTILTGSSKIGGERLQITISSIQYADNVIPVELEVYDTDGIQGIFVPNSDEVAALKEIAANMGTSMGSSITITDGDAGSQLAADLGRSVIQGTSQFFSKKMREVKVTLKAGYKVLLLPKA